jgi:hypothetical protein
VKLKPKAVNKPLHYFIVHELDKPGSSATVSVFCCFLNVQEACYAQSCTAHPATDHRDYEQQRRRW